MKLLLERLQAVTVEPGDIIIATVPVDDDVEFVAREVKEHLQAEFPDNKIVVLAGLELWVGRRPGGSR